MKILESFSAFYRPLKPPRWTQARGADREKNALKAFLGYAYGGRANAPKGYQIVAAHCVHSLPPDREQWASETKAVWNEFVRLMPMTEDKKTKKLRPATNEKRNPLSPMSSAVSLFRFDEIVGCLEEGDLVQAFSAVIKIQGVGGKVAAFYLRDVADFLPIDRSKWKIEQYAFMQPVDFWLRIIIDELGMRAERTPSEFDRIAQKLRDSIADTAKRGKDVRRIWGICDACEKGNIDPLHFNQGAWWFAANIAGTEEYLKEIVSDAKQVVHAAYRLGDCGLVPDRFTEFERAITAKGLSSLLPNREN